MVQQTLDLHRLFNLERKVALVTGGSREIGHNSPLGRVVEPEEMAGIAVYLRSGAGPCTHGAVIPLCGGTSINHQHAQIVEKGA